MSLDNGRTCRSRMIAAVVIPCAILASVAVRADGHGIAMHGDPKYRPGFLHLDYVNPAAPKGGTFRQAVVGTFDSLNPFIIRGVKAHGRRLVHETLLKRTWDEPFSLYGLLAESIVVPADRSSITFVLRPEARFHDGSPVTPDDVVFSWETLKDEAGPIIACIIERFARSNGRTRARSASCSIRQVLTGNCR